MKKFFLIAFYIFLTGPALAQRVSDLPQATLPLSGNELLSLDQNNVSKKIPSSALILGGTVLGIANGGTGLSSVGPAGTCLVSTGTALIYSPCGNTPPTPGSFIVTQTQVIIQTQSGVGIVTEQ